jgi:hypothetical protein
MLGISFGESLEVRWRRSYSPNPKNASTFKFEAAETTKRRGLYGFSGNPRRVVRFYRRGGMTGKR